MKNNVFGVSYIITAPIYTMLLPLDCNIKAFDLYIQHSTLENVYELLIQASNNRQYKFIEWLINRRFTSPYLAFFECCIYGHLETAKRLIKTYREIDVYHDQGIVFRSSCTHGQLEIVEWLYGTFPKINFDDDFTFRWTCIREHLGVAKWIMNLFKINLREGNDFTFRWCCKNNQVDVAEWLATMCCDYVVKVHDSKIILYQIMN